MGPAADLIKVHIHALELQIRSAIVATSSQQNLLQPRCSLEVLLTHQSHPIRARQRFAACYVSIVAD